MTDRRNGKSSTRGLPVAIILSLQTIFGLIFSVAALISVFVTGLHVPTSNMDLLVFFFASLSLMVLIVTASGFRSGSRKSVIFFWTIAISVMALIVVYALSAYYMASTGNQNMSKDPIGLASIILVPIIVFAGSLFLYGRRIAFIGMVIALILILSIKGGAMSGSIQSNFLIQADSSYVSLLFHITWLTLLMMIGTQSVLLIMRESSRRNIYTLFLRLSIIALIAAGGYTIGSVVAIFLYIPAVVILALYTLSWFQSSRTAHGDRTFTLRR